MASRGHYCSSDDCNTNSAQGVSFFRLPKDPIRCQQWKENLGFVGPHKYSELSPEEANGRIRICSSHFDSYSFTSSGKRLLNTAVPTKLQQKVSGERDLQGEDDSFKKLNEELINDIKELRIHPENKPNPLFYEKLQDLIFKICPTPEIAEFIGEQISRAQNMLKVSDSKQALPLVEPKPQRGGSYQDDHFIDAIVKREDDFDQLMDIETPLESSSKQEDLHLDEKIEICKEELLDSDKDNYNIPLNKKIITENNGEPCRTYEDPADELTSYHSLENNLVQKVLHTPVVTLDCSGNTDRFFQSLSSLAKTLNPLDQVILQSNVANMVFGMKIAHLTKNSSVNT